MTLTAPTDIADDAGGDERHGEEGDDGRDSDADPVEERKGAGDFLLEFESFHLGQLGGLLKLLEFHLLQEVLSFEGRHASLVLQGLDGLMQQWPAMIPEDPVGVPSPSEDFRVVEDLGETGFSVDLVLI